MHSRTTRLVTLLGASLLLASCAADHATAPTGVAINAASAAADKGPSALGASPTSPTRIDLAWQDNSPNEDGFEVYRSTTGPTGTFTLRASTGPNVTSYADLGLTPGTQYCYEVRNFKRTGGKTTWSSYSAVACARTPAPPAAASNLDAAPRSSYSVGLTWRDNSSTETGFRIERAASAGGPWEFAAYVDANVTTASDARYPEQLVCYRVIAYNADGGADASNVDCTAPPNAPTGLTAKAVGPHDVDLAWADNSAVEDGYQLLRSTDASTWAVVATLPANAVSYRDGGLASDAYYYYYVRAARDGGFSDPSYTASAYPVGSAPAAPTGVNATPSGSSAIWMTWDWVPGADSFFVQRASAATGPWTSVGTTTNTYFSEGGLVADQRVCYQVIAHNDFGDSPASGADCTAPPSPATDLAATAVDYQSIQLTWSASPATNDGYTVRDGFTIYRYDYICDGWDCYYDYTPVAWVAADATSFVDSGLAPETWYSYYVVASNDGGGSDWSNEANTTTPAAPIASGVAASARPHPTASALRAAVARAKVKAALKQTTAREAAARAAAAKRSAAKHPSARKTK